MTKNLLDAGSTEDNIAELLTLRKVVDKGGTICYYNSDNLLHRVHGPAIIWTCGSQEWCYRGKLHRTDGPAVEYSNGHKEWFIDGIFIRRSPG